MPLLPALEAGSEAISLLAALSKLIKDTKSNNSPNKSLQELLHRLQIDAVRLSRDLENRLRTFSDHMQEYNLDPTLSLNQQFANLEWYNFISRSRLKTLREECHAIHRQLTAFLDDATSILICVEREQDASQAFKENLDTKRKLDRMFLEPNTPLGDLVENMLKTASAVSAELQMS